jgi:hypothetical protein
MSLYNPQKFGSSTINWIGQIVDDGEWKENRKGEIYNESSDIPGWGYRYKIRIFGKHPSTGLKDAELPFADVLYPVTSGSGHAGSFQTPNLRKGDFVFGIYLDGIDQTQPLIIGCFGNNDQTELQFSRPNQGFIPFSGFYDGEKVPVYSIPPGGSPPIGGASPHEGVGLGDNQNSEANEAAKRDGDEETALPISEKCAKSLDKTQLELKRFIRQVEEAQKRTKNWSYWVNQKGSEIASGKFKFEDIGIDIDIQASAQNIAKELKEIISGIRQFITEKIDAAISDVYDKFFPEEEKKVEEAHNKVVDTITCLFNKIIANLIKILGDLLKQLIGRFINVPLCAVENVLAGILGQLLGLILGTLQSVLGGITSIIGFAIDLAGDVLGFVAKILGFFLCDEDSACPETKKWSAWGNGSSGVGFNFDSIFNKVKSISQSANQIIDPDNFDFNLNFDSIFDNPCNVGPIFCGPPRVEFYGGGGSGASGNAIISATGSILGVDIINQGLGYNKSPIVKFIDDCGIGRGASGRVKIKNGKVEKVIIDNPGYDYIPEFDGNRGGDGRIFAVPEEIIVKRKDKTYELYEQNEEIRLGEGDVVDGPYRDLQTIITPTSTLVPTPIPVSIPISETSIFPTNSKGDYLVNLEISEIEIQSTGVNYSPDDQIIVEPNNGAILVPEYGPFGSVINVNIINGGSGFTEYPNIYIKTQTGYNVELIPIMGIKKIEDITKEEEKVIIDQAFIKVVDCVGKF